MNLLLIIHACTVFCRKLTETVQMYGRFLIKILRLVQRLDLGRLEQSIRESGMVRLLLLEYSPTSIIQTPLDISENLYC